ncbi:MAG: hypothetical protein ABSF31_10770 [Steroidobacteraceae bacterium]|jgi:hypothetical protein
MYDASLDFRLREHRTDCAGKTLQAVYDRDKETPIRNVSDLAIALTRIFAVSSRVLPSWGVLLRTGWAMAWAAAK